MSMRLGRTILLVLAIVGPGVPALAAGGAQADTVPTVPGSPAALLAAAKASMVTDPAEAGKSAQLAQGLAMRLPESTARTITIATALWLRSEALGRQNMAVAAAPLVDAAVKSVAAIRPAIKLQGDLLQTRAGLENRLGQPQAALRDYQRAFAIFGKVGSARSQAVALQNIGLIYLEANDLDKVYYYYRLAEETYPSDPMLSLSGHSNIAGALFSAKRYRETEVEYRRAYAIAVRLNNPTLETQLLNNLARTQLVRGELDAAEASEKQAFKAWQVNKAPEMVPEFLKTRAEIALDRHRTGEAVSLVERALAAVGVPADTRPYWQLQYTAYRAYAQAGDTAKALAHFETYKQLEDQSRTLAASTSAALMAAQFDFADQNARIATLKAGELERDIALARLQARQNMIILGSLLLIAISIAVVLAFYLRSLRRSRNAIREVNAQLTVVNAELSDALAAKSLFLATTSHEIRTPLNGILGMTQVLLADPALTGLMRERIGLLQGAGETMRALVDDILDFAKMDAGRLELHSLEAELPRLFDDIVDFWRDRAAQQGLTLMLDRSSAPERILIDSRRLRQILGNLLSNAIKFTPAGSVTVTVTTAANDADATASDAPADRGERLRIAVSDTGIGIAAADHVVVFDKFRQLDGGTTRRFGGTGLGLAISRMLAQAMGGDIELTSSAGAGSTFTLDLPLERPIAAVAFANAAERPSTLAAARLVLVTASPISQGVLRAVLTPQVASFAVAANMPAAVERIAARSVDLIVVDIAAPPDPDLEGSLDVLVPELAAMAATAHGGGIALAVLWPSSRPADLARLLAAGIDGVVGKPVTSRDLVQGLQAIFETPEDKAAAQPVVAPRELATT